jgi:tetratricopeptide (TPR) repeat protein
VRRRTGRSGDYQIDHGDLHKAQARLQRVLTLAKTDAQASNKYWALTFLGDIKQSDPGNAGWQRDLAVSYEKIADVQMAQGDLADALKSYQKSLAIADWVAKSEPGNAGRQCDLSVSYEKVGNVQKVQGDLPGALKSHSDGLAIRDRLAKSDPGTTRGWQAIFRCRSTRSATCKSHKATLPAG